MIVEIVLVVLEKKLISSFLKIFATKMHVDQLSTSTVNAKMKNGLKYSQAKYSQILKNVSRSVGFATEKWIVLTDPTR